MKWRLSKKMLTNLGLLTWSFAFFIRPFRPLVIRKRYEFFGWGLESVHQSSKDKRKLFALQNFSDQGKMHNLSKFGLKILETVGS